MKVRRNFFKCCKCRKEWSVRRDSILEDLKVPFTKFILAIKLFVLEVPVNKEYKELEFRYNYQENMNLMIFYCLGGIN